MPRIAKAVNVSEIIECLLDEVHLALKECLSGLTDEQVWSHPVVGRHSLGTIIQHTLLCLDCYGCQFQVGQFAVDHQDAFSIYERSLEEVEKAIEHRDQVGTLLARTDAVCEKAKAGVHGIGREELLGSRKAEDWCKEWGRNSLEVYLRAILHAQGHIRQVWLIRGSIGMTRKDQDQWPTQIYA